MKKLINTLYTALLFAPSAIYGVTPAEVGTRACNLNPGAVGCDSSRPILGAGGIFENAIEVVIGVVAALSVLMIVIGGLRYVLSGGDSAGIKNAKDTIVYAIVGLIISMLAFVVVRFVIGAVK